MKAASLKELGKIRIIDIPEPEIRDAHDVKVKVKAVGICGTDLHMFRERRGDVTLPRIMGHELSGEVVETGSAVSRVKPGDHVVLDPVYACGKCATCKKGHPNVCSNVKCYGVQMDGGYQEYIVTGEEHLYAYSPDISHIRAALTEPFSIAANITQKAAIEPGETMLIIGAGTIGLAVLQVAKSMGAYVMICDVSDGKLSKAVQMGADKTVNSKKENMDLAIRDFSPYGFDVVLDAVGVSPLFEQSLQYAAPCGRIMCIGFDSRDVRLLPVDVTKKELSIIGSRMNNGKFPLALQWLNEGRINADLMVSRTYALDDIQKAFEETLEDSANTVKTVIVME